MRKIFLLLLFAVTVSGYAVPAKRGVWATLKLVDGTEVRAMLCGDEHMRFFRAEDGTCYVKSPDGQTFVKADMGGLRDKAAKRQMKASKRRASKMRKARKALGDDFSGQYLGEKKGLIITAISACLCTCRAAMHRKKEGLNSLNLESAVRRGCQIFRQIIWSLLFMIRLNGIFLLFSPVLQVSSWA